MVRGLKFRPKYDPGSFATSSSKNYMSLRRNVHYKGRVWVRTISMKWSSFRTKVSNEKSIFFLLIFHIDVKTMNVNISLHFSGPETPELRFAGLLDRSPREEARTGLAGIRLKYYLKNRREHTGLCLASRTLSG